MPDEPVKIKELEGTKAMLYMLFAIEARLKVQTDILIEMAEIITQKDAGTISQEIAQKTIKELKAIKDRFVEDDELLAFINNLKV
jgi:hypothetical protein